MFYPVFIVTLSRRLILIPAYIMSRIKVDQINLEVKKKKRIVRRKCEIIIFGEGLSKYDTNLKTHEKSIDTFFFYNETK